jgi:hypothetical protein
LKLIATSLCLLTLSGCWQSTTLPAANWHLIDKACGETGWTTFEIFSLPLFDVRQWSVRCKDGREVFVGAISQYRIQESQEK